MGASSSIVTLLSAADWDCLQSSPELIKMLQLLSAELLEVYDQEKEENSLFSLLQKVTSQRRERVIASLTTQSHSSIHAPILKEHFCAELPPNLSLTDGEIVPVLELETAAIDDEAAIDSEIRQFATSSIEEIRDTIVHSSISLAISIECQEVVDLEPVLSCCIKNSTGQAPILHLVGLNVSNNQIDSIDADIMLQLTHLLHLHIGGNPVINNITSAVSQPAAPNSIWHCLPASLLILDLSYTSKLVLPIGCFLGCPQLLKLVMDGCDICSTNCVIKATSDAAAVTFTVTATVGKAAAVGMITDMGSEPAAVNHCASKSIFFALLQLQELSLKENNISDVSDLLGLRFFVKFRRLRRLWLSDNAVLNTEASRKTVTRFLQSEFACDHSSFSDVGLQFIDDKPLFPKDQVGIIEDRVSLNSKLQQQTDITGGMQITNNMEAEFHSALKGEKDVAMVS